MKTSVCQEKNTRQVIFGIDRVDAERINTHGEQGGCNDGPRIGQKP